MPHHLMPNIFGACFSGQIIVLDMIRDRYVVLSHGQSAAVAPYLGLDSAFFEAKIASNTGILQKLVDADLVTAQTFSVVDPKLNSVSPSPQMGGMSANGWKLADNAFEHRPAWRWIARALLDLRAAHKSAAKQGLTGVLKRCSQAIGQNELRFGQTEEYTPFVNALNWACLFYPKPTKCLEWSAALTLVCARAGLASKLIIGVQSFPFYAHAWSETDHAIIGDSTLRREELSVILEFPTPLLELPYDRARHRLSYSTGAFNAKPGLGFNA
ncbi:lasso peptide biosynthesis B2 protein [Mycoavidus sp. B2-EB]|uniref:lasso peptide biosynthesis B2 protein n=1 Tax=Mycoavidus sp. B2-EB TaxID=2651972 RepID=UPI001E2E83E5|nr:lasso peptide biosynthesis B2 protein [Mycoavidus sp. B2-EB]